MPAARGMRLRRNHGHARPAAGRLACESEAHPAARAVADVSNRVEWLAGSAGRDQHPQAVERQRAFRFRRPARSLRAAAVARGSRPTPHSPREASAPSPGSITRAPRSRRRAGSLGGRVLVHAVVHRRRDHDRRRTGEVGGADEVVGRAGRELGDRVGARRSDAVDVTAVDQFEWLIGSWSGRGSPG